MRAGRCKYTQPIFLKAERGLRDAALAAAQSRGLSLSELIRQQLREIVAARPVASPEARP